jgi:hypothetical protein
LGLINVARNGNHGPVFPPKSKLLQRRIPLVKKTAVKKSVVVKKPASFIRDFRDAQRLAKDLQLEIGKLKKKIDALCMTGFIVGPPNPPKSE